MAAHLDQPRAYARYNTAFHRRIAKVSPNAPLRSMYVTLLDFFENNLAADPPAAVGEDVGAGFGGREQDVVHGFVVNPEPAQGVAEDAPHHRHAEGLAPEYQAKLHIRHRLHSRLATRTH